MATITDVHIASVAGADFDAALAHVVARNLPRAAVRFAKSAARQAGVTNSYLEPTRMGVDRWLVLLAARARYPEQPVLVVDAGTALTLDLLAADGRHSGGYILPGVMMTRRVLLQDTQQVRYDDDVSACIAPGQSTGECVVHGSWMAALASIEYVARQAGNPVVVVSGGDAKALISLGLAAQHCPNLVFEGLACAARDISVR